MCKRNNEWNEIMKFKNELTKIKHIAFVLPYVKHVTVLLHKTSD